MAWMLNNFPERGAFIYQYNTTQSNSPQALFKVATNSALLSNAVRMSALYLWVIEGRVPELLDGGQTQVGASLANL
jgi:hypothetical protein